MDEPLHLRPNPGPEPVPLTWTWKGGLGLLLLGQIVIVLVALGWLKLRSPKRFAQFRADEWALTALDKIATTHRADYIAISDIVREYMSLRFNLPASRQTTAEFMRTLHASDHLTPAQKERLSEFLHRADLVKFARVAPGVEETAALRQAARQLIVETAPSPVSAPRP